MIRRTLATLLLVAALSACGGKVALQQKEGEAPPPIPRGATEPPTAQQLVEPSTQARPERNAELLRQSKERDDDPFDLPPDDK